MQVIFNVKIIIMKQRISPIKIIFLISGFIMFIWILKTCNYNGANSTNKIESNGILEIRFCPKNNINIRTGPGINFEKDPSGQLIKGEKLYVLEEKNGWVRFRVTSNDVGWSGWVKKDLTISKNQWDSNKDTNELIKLRESGLLIKINPQLNVVYVNSSIWQNLDYQTKENIGRVLAFYCGRKKGTNLNWVDIKDSYSGKKLAKYSENWGFKTY